MKTPKLFLSGLLSSMIILMSVPAFAQSNSISEFEKYRLDVINQELSLSGLPQVKDTQFNSLKALTSNEKINDKIEKLKKAEIVIMNFDENGELVEADSSDSGDVINRFGKASKGKNTAKTNEVKILSAVANTTPAPSGSLTGAFQRILSAQSTSSLSYTGGVADDITIPSYDANTANTYGEGAYMYTGFDQSGVGVAEVGFGTYKGAQGTGWFALFHAKATHDITLPSDGNDALEYYYDFAHPYTGGQVITGYKVYYHTVDATLTVTYQIGYSNLYVVQFTGRNSLNIATKRVTSIAMPSTTTGVFHVPFGSYANWGNYRYLINDGASTVYPTAASGVTVDSWNHGGTLDYIKTIISTTDRDEQYKIY